MNVAAERLRKEVFDCEHCAQSGDFMRSPMNGRFYKFPPVIGKQSNAEVLFVGINPRRSNTNKTLHEWLMAGPDNFAKLAGNESTDGRQYIAMDGEEKHYHCHAMVVEGVFGVGTKFEAVAAVTELMLCASVNEPPGLSLKKSPCAELYLRRVIEIVKPQAVVAVGSGVRRHLLKHFGDIVRTPLVAMVHPALLFRKSREEKLVAMRPTWDGVRTALAERRCRT